MQHLWAPWRVEYIMMPKPAGCILCEKPAQNEDERNYILYRGERNFVILNAFPYNPGHAMVVPYKHVAGLDELSGEDVLEHWEIVKRCIAWISEAMHPAGFNIGINVGKAAGAGVVGHIHTHVVPRWEGDVNFMTVIPDTRVVPEALAATYEKLKGQVVIV